MARDSDTDMVPDKSRQASDKIDKRGDLSHTVTFKLAFFPAKGFNLWVVEIGGEERGRRRCQTRMRKKRAKAFLENSHVSKQMTS